MRKVKEKFNDLNVGLKFLILVIILYLLILIFSKQIFLVSLNQFFDIAIKILPSLVTSFLLIFVFNYFLDNTKIKKYLTSELNWKKYLLTAFLGILSSGPIYFWYPFLADLKEDGLSDGLISVFLYNRAIKIPLIPIMLFYFSIEFILLLSTLMIIFSIINGIIINKLMNKNYVSSNSIH